MGFHTFPVERADDLEDVTRFQFVSRGELVGHLGADPDATVADLGSGTGFYTDELAPFFGTVYAVDVQAAMGAYYRSKGLPGNVRPVTAAVESLPVPDGALDGAVSTMTFHEFATESTLTEVRRTLAPEARFVVADWSAAGTGERGPPTEERFGVSEARSLCEAADFDVQFAQTRPETFLLVAAPA